MKFMISKKNISIFLSIWTIIYGIINVIEFASYAWDKYGILTDRRALKYKHLDISNDEILQNINIILLFSSSLILLQIIAIVSNKESVKLISIVLFTLFLFGLHEYNIYLSSKWLSKG